MSWRTERCSSASWRMGAPGAMERSCRNSGTLPVPPLLLGLKAHGKQLQEKKLGCATDPGARTTGHHHRAVSKREGGKCHTPSCWFLRRWVGVQALFSRNFDGERVHLNFRPRQNWSNLGRETSAPHLSLRKATQRSRAEQASSSKQSFYLVRPSKLEHKHMTMVRRRDASAFCRPMTFGLLSPQSSDCSPSFFLPAFFSVTIRLHAHAGSLTPVENSSRSCPLLQIYLLVTGTSCPSVVSLLFVAR